jgi:hypothetical protein
MIALENMAFMNYIRVVVKYKYLDTNSNPRQKWSRHMYNYKVIKDVESVDNRFKLTRDEVVLGNGYFVDRIGILKDGKWDLVDKSALHRMRCGSDRRQGLEERRQINDRRDDSSGSA